MTKIHNLINKLETEEFCVLFLKDGRYSLGSCQDRNFIASVDEALVTMKEYLAEDTAWFSPEMIESVETLLNAFEADLLDEAQLIANIYLDKNIFNQSL